MSSTIVRPEARKGPAKVSSPVYGEGRGGVPIANAVIAKKRPRGRGVAVVKVYAGPIEVFDYLKGSTVIERHRLVSKGLPKKALEDAIHWFDEIPKQVVLDAIGISQKTVDRKDQDEPLNPQHSNALFSLLEVSSLAESILGSKQLAEQWMNSPAIGLDGAKPISLLGTGPGVEAVKDLLSRIDYGVYA